MVICYITGYYRHAKIVCGRNIQLTFETAPLVPLSDQCSHLNAHSIMSRI